MPRFPLLPLIAIGASACALMQGCDDSDPVAAAIDRASMELSSVNPARGPGLSAKARADRYNAVLASLRAPGAEPTEAQRAVILLLQADAEIGLAQGSVAAALHAERDVVGQIRDARSLLALWSDHKSREVAARRYDSSSELAEIDTGIAERDAQIAEAQATKDAIDAKIASLEAESAKLTEQARGERELESGLRERSRATNAVEGATLIEQARVHQRAADALEGDVERLAGQIDHLRKEAAEAELEVERLRAQRELLGKARTDVLGRAAESTRQAVEAAAEAEATATRLHDVLVTIQAARSDSGEMAQAYNEAIDAFAKATSTAKQAQSFEGVRTVAKATIGGAQQALGDVHGARIRGIETYISLLERIEEASNGLPQSAVISGELEAARAQVVEARRLSSAAYQEARTTYGAAGLRDDVDRQRLERLDAMLNQLGPAEQDESAG